LGGGVHLNNRVSDLSSREREALLLLAAGHDAKSIARELGISVHSVNERLRTARRKLNVSSSRQAARLLSAELGEPHKFLGYTNSGVGSGKASGPPEAQAAARPKPGLRRPLAYFIAGAVMSTLLAAILFLSAAGPARDPQTARATVVATSPAQGSVIKPGRFLLSVTYDRPLAAQSYSFVQVSPQSYPHCEGSAVLSRDRRTYTLRCTASPGRSYEVWFNRPPYMNFRSADGVPAEPFRLRFKAAD
jgi:DNA-binding CsgD family transcriptional regulator